MYRRRALEGPPLPFFPKDESMDKYVVSLSALILAGACNSAFARDDGVFFVNAGAGQVTYHVDAADGCNYAGDKTDAACPPTPTSAPG
jgi:hypothetical protein